MGKIAGRRTGLLAAGLPTVIPEAAGSSLGRLDRFPTLDPVAGAFMVLSVVVAPIVFHCFLANVALSYYWVMWTPMVLILAALGSAAVITRVTHMARTARPAVPIAILTGIAVLAIPATETVAESVTVAQLKPTGVMVVPRLMREHDLHGNLVNAGLPADGLDARSVADSPVSAEKPERFQAASAGSHIPTQTAKWITRAAASEPRSATNRDER